MNQWRPLYFTACYSMPENINNQHMNQWRPFYFTVGYTRLANIPFQRFFHKTPATCFLSETFSFRKVYSPWHSYLVSRLRFSLQEPLVAHGALCTYIFPCRNLSLHTVHFVLTFFPVGTSRCTRCTLYLHFSLQELLVAQGALCTCIFPCRNFSLHTVHFVLTFFPAGTSRCTRCSSSPPCSSSTDKRHSCGTSTNRNDCTVMVLSNWMNPTNVYSYQAKANRISVNKLRRTE